MTMTQRRLLPLLAAAVLALSGPVAAGQQLKFGHFDSGALLKEMPDVKTVENTINDASAKVEAQLTILNEDFKKQLDDYQKKGATMTDAECDAKETELQEMKERIETFVSTSRQDLSRQQQELMAPILQKVLRAVQEVGAEGGFIYIFERQAPLLLATGAKSVDIAQQVRVKLKLPAQK